MFPNSKHGKRHDCSVSRKHVSQLIYRILGIRTHKQKVNNDIYTWWLSIFETISKKKIMILFYMYRYIEVIAEALIWETLT